MTALCFLGTASVFFLLRQPMLACVFLPWGVYFLLPDRDDEEEAENEEGSTDRQ